MYAITLNPINVKGITSYNGYNDNDHMNDTEAYNGRAETVCWQWKRDQDEFTATLN